MRPVPKKKYADACGISRQGVHKAIARGDVVMRPDGKVDLDNSTNKTYMEHSLETNVQKGKAEGKAKAAKKKVKTSTKKKGKSPGRKKSGAKVVKKSAAEIENERDKSAAEIETGKGDDQGDLDYGEAFDLDSIPPELRQIFRDGIGENKKGHLDALKAFEEIKSKIQDRQSKRLLLVQRALVRQTFSKLYVVDTTELKPLGIRLAPDVASLVQNKVEAIRNEEPAYKDSPILMRVNEFVNSTDFMREIDEIATGEVMKTLEHIKRIMDEFLLDLGAEPLEGELEPDEEPELAEVVE